MTVTQLTPLQRIAKAIELAGIGENPAFKMGRADGIAFQTQPHVAHPEHGAGQAVGVTEDGLVLFVPSGARGVFRALHVCVDDLSEPDQHVTEGVDR